MSTRQKDFFRFLTLLMGIVVAILIAVSFFFKKGDDVLIMNGNHNLFLDYLFYYVTSFGNGLIAAPVLLLSFFIHRRFFYVTAMSFWAVAVITSIVKRLTDAPRPVAILGKENLHAVFDIILHSHNSFPSGHTATAFCAATLMALFMGCRYWAMALMGVATLVGLSRIYLAEHFLVDVAWGAFTGGISVCISYFFLARIPFSKTQDANLIINR